MGLLDRILGRGKKAAGGATDDQPMRRESETQEPQGMAQERPEMHEEQAPEEREGM